MLGELFAGCFIFVMVIALSVLWLALCRAAAQADEQFGTRDE